MSLMNPEFRRNLWLELTPARLGVAFLAVVSLLALAGVRDDGLRSLSYASELLFGVVIFLWGGRLAADSVTQEITDRTWDTQRMSALGPWAMTWGKLAGAPICAWAASIPALAVMIFLDGIEQAATYVLLGVLCHAIAMALSLQLIRKGRQPGRVKTLFFQFAGLIAVLPFAYFLIWDDQRPGLDTVYWFSQRFTLQSFALVSALLFSAWAVLAVYRQMRLELQKPTVPTVWLCFLVFLIVYQTGLIFGGSQSVQQVLREFSGSSLLDAQPISASIACAGILLSVMVYVAIFTEPKTMIGLRQAWDAMRAANWRRLWLHTPRWAVTLVLTTVALVLIVLLVDIPTTKDGSDSEFHRLVVAAFLFLLRNVGIVLLCNFMARSGRGDLAAIIVLIVLSVIAPMIFGGASPVVAALFWPPIEGGWGMTLIPVIAQLILIGGLLVRVWMQAEKQRNKLN